MDAALEPLRFFFVVTGLSGLGPPWPGDLKSPAKENGFRFDRAVDGTKLTVKWRTIIRNYKQEILTGEEGIVLNVQSLQEKEKQQQAF